VVKELNLPFPNVEFQALLTEIAAQKPDVVFAFFAGGGAVKFVKDYDAAGLKKTVPLYGLGLPDRRHAGGAGRLAEGLLTALHYADGMTRRATTPSATGLRQDLQAAARRLCGAGL
jgi:branched-chain amino acid transport system substrate-binding protein